MTSSDQSATAPVDTPPTAVSERAPSEGRTRGVKHAAIGFLMGSADVVPGVSGGTMALVCGIYPRLIAAVGDGSHAVATLLRGDVRGAVRRLRALDWMLLLPLGLGLGIAVLSLAPVLEHMLEEQPVRLAGLFLGLVLGSVVVSLRLLRSPDTTAVIIGVVAAVALFVVLGLREETTAEAADAATAPAWAYPLSAMIAICAMILPGISGSFLLVLMGMYGNVLAAVNDREIGLLLLFAAGCAIGLGLFSHVLAWLLEHHYDRVVAAMIGLMVGSLRVLWPWPGGTSTTELAGPSGDVGIPVLLAVAGFVVVVVIGRLGLGGHSSHDAHEVPVVRE
jgi:putative membrane protein